MIENILRSLTFAVSMALLAATCANAQWTTFTPKYEEFSVEVPAPITEPDFIFRNELDKRLQRAYGIISEDTFINIFSASGTNGSETATLNEGLDKYLGTPEKVVVDSRPATLYKSVADDGFIYRALCLSGQSRTYCFYVISSAEVSAGADRFFNSIKITPREISYPAANAAPVELSRPYAEEIAKVNAWLAEKQKQNAAKPTPTQAVKPRPLSERGSDEPVRLLAKPQARYTDVARRFGIQGKVQIRATFGSDGVMRNITVIRGLPFGLTKGAVEAAKGMVFEPAIKAGQPIAVTRTIEYSFTIY